MPTENLTKTAILTGTAIVTFRKRIEGLDEQEAAELMADEVEQLKQDAERINWLATQARMIYGHKGEASYQLCELPDLIQSSREECRPDDLRRAIDEAMEASR